MNGELGYLVYLDWNVIVCMESKRHHGDFQSLENNVINRGKKRKVSTSMS